MDYNPTLSMFWKKSIHKTKKQMKFLAAPLGRISATTGPRLAGFPFHSNKLRDIKLREV